MFASVAANGFTATRLIFAFAVVPVRGAVYRLGQQTPHGSVGGLRPDSRMPIATP
jgi:hypothetical protein